MYHLKKEEMNKIAPLFNGWEDTLIWSCLQGYMGDAWTDNIDNPKSAQIITGDFCFLSGIPNKDLVNNIPEYYSSQDILMIPPTNEWENLIEMEYAGKFDRFMRYSIKKEKDVFDISKLSANVEKLSSQYKIRKIDEELYNQVLKQSWLEDLCSQFPTYDDYKKYGIGFVILHNDKIVSGASSYTVYDKGIEIEIDTKKKYRRKGLAHICASKLILECLDRGIYPSWDAANKASVALAEKLGYHFDREYVTYAVNIFE
ncbi:acetyltransferase [Vallitalea longa]|uniref:Acetyltransferase n=1 Tax=Vallitalea longa TaxID=2936439 RepID=A0A9W6DEF9_9FIRM|nr:GNAT family N-acetyltransferase [Vallitalea longa]GKX29490.1 acetyltransferase [Vallitalea longa]